MTHSPIRQAIVLCALALCAGSPSCTAGTDTGNPLTSADVSACKSEALEGSGAAVNALAQAAPENRFDGLFCLRAERGEDDLALDAYNFAGGCHIEWKAEARQRDGGLYIALTNPSCAVAACGSCLYDASFSASLDALAAGEERIGLVDEPCEGDATELGAFRVPEAAGEVELHCEYARYLEWHAQRTGSFGQENMPCHGTALDSEAGEPSEPSCEPGLTCVPLSESDQRCLKQCDTKDDCAVPSVMQCNAGLCVLPEE